jgi:hypothetical protein
MISVFPRAGMQHQIGVKAYGAADEMKGCWQELDVLCPIDLFCQLLLLQLVYNA